MGEFTQHQAHGDRWGVPVSKCENSFCTGVSRAHQKSFELNLKGKWDKTTLARDKPGGSTIMFEAWCASEDLCSGVSVEIGEGGPYCSREKGY